jgi:hypothetical protein
LCWLEPQNSPLAGNSRQVTSRSPGVKLNGSKTDTESVNGQLPTLAPTRAGHRATVPARCVTRAGVIGASGAGCPGAQRPGTRRATAGRPPHSGAWTCGPRSAGNTSCAARHTSAILGSWLRRRSLSPWTTTCWRMSARRSRPGGPAVRRRTSARLCLPGWHARPWPGKLSAGGARSALRPWRGRARPSVTPPSLAMRCTWRRSTLSVRSAGKRRRDRAGCHRPRAGTCRR